LRQRSELPLKKSTLLKNKLKKENREERREEFKNGYIAIDWGATSPRPRFLLLDGFFV
jgi:hypothetical protein